MKKTLLIVAAAAFMMGTSAAMAKPFCASCHAGHKNKVGPAFATVVEAYGSVDAVFEFLNSDAPLEPKVTKFAKKSKIMKSQLKKYRKLNDGKKAKVRAWFEDQVK
jgi:cytochrome c551/c552